jgi:hypothetical protein
MSKAINNFGSDFQADLNSAERVGNAMEAADRDFNTAIATGDQKIIAQAQIKSNRAQEQLAAFVKTKDKEHDLIMQIIQSLGGA